MEGKSIKLFIPLPRLPIRSCNDLYSRINKQQKRYAKLLQIKRIRIYRIRLSCFHLLFNIANTAYSTTYNSSSEK